MKKCLLCFAVLFVFLSCNTRGDGGKDNPQNKSSEAKIVKFDVKSGATTSHSFVINHTAMTVTLSLRANHGLDLANLTPVIEVSKGAKVNPASGAKQDFSNGKTVEYTVTAEDGKTTKKYTASVQEEPKKLEVEKIEVYGIKVENGKVTIGETLSSVQKGNVTVVFKDSDTPKASDIIMTPESLTLEKKGDKGTITLSTIANAKWQAWTSDAIEVTRGGTEEKSTEAKILTFDISTRTVEFKGKVDEDKKTVTVEVDDTLNLNEPQKTSITVSKGASVSPTSGVKQNFSNSEAQPVEYTVTAEDGTTKVVYKVTVKVGKSKEANILEFKVGDAMGSFQKDDNTKIWVEVPFGTDLTKIKPTITVSPKATVNPASDVQQDFSDAKEVTYTVTAEDTTVTKTYKVRVRKELPDTITKILGKKVEFNNSTNKWEVEIPVQTNDLTVDNIEVSYSDGGTTKTFAKNQKHILSLDQAKIKATGEAVMVLQVMLDKDHVIGILEIHITVK